MTLSQLFQIGLFLITGYLLFYYDNLGISDSEQLSDSRLTSLQVTELKFKFKISLTSKSKPLTAD